MKLGKLHLENFGAYKELDFDYSNQGLCLISGPTKAGKSTLLDGPCWVLYGTTSKDSAADDMRSWFAHGPTTGWVEVDTATGPITVYRVRGKASENDLHWEENGDGNIRRGKDLKDTQRLIEERLGVTAELYIIGSYMHQFSNADTFFVAKAKDRREVLERLADLSLPIKLGARASEVRKEKKKELEQLNQESAKLEGRLEQVVRTRSSCVVNFEKWETEKGHKLLELEEKAQNFEETRKEHVAHLVDKIEELDKLVVNPSEIKSRMEQIKIQIKALDQAKKDFLLASKKLAIMEADYRHANKECERLETLEKSGACPTCNSPLVGNHHFSGMYGEINYKRDGLAGELDKFRTHYKALEQAVSIENKIRAAYDKCRQDETTNEHMIKELSELRAKVIAAKSEPNRHHESIEALKAEANPYDSQIANCDKTMAELQDEIQKVTEIVSETEHLIASLNWLYDKSFELRATMLERAKNELTDKTNKYLEQFFDADLRINLTFESSDKLNVDIINEGYSCPYKQLSGGERCMLKIAFNLASMKRVEDVAGVKFGAVMLDEALNGLDASLKGKAFKLLQTLQDDYETVLLIDHHEEFKSLFHNQYHVVKENGYSTLASE